MHRCAHVHTCTCAHAYMCACPHAKLCTGPQVHMCTCLHSQMWSCPHLHMPTCTCTYISRKCVRNHTHIWSHLGYIYICIYIYIYHLATLKKLQAIDMVTVRMSSGHVHCHRWACAPILYAQMSWASIRPRLPLHPQIRTMPFMGVCFMLFPHAHKCLQVKSQGNCIS